jgi:ethanolamine ammonia-lyase small subunit
MKTCHANVIVYIKEPLNPEQNHRVRASVNALHGVLHAGSSSRTEAVVCVDYDPAVTSSQRILNRVTEQGYSARLVGM